VKAFRLSTDFYIVAMERDIYKLHQYRKGDCCVLPIQQLQQQQQQQRRRRFTILHPNRIRLSFQQREINSSILNASTNRRQYQQQGYNNTRETYECNMKHHTIFTALLSPIEAFWNKLIRIRHLSTMVGILLVVLHTSSMMMIVTGHWIDPDTPKDAYTTVPIPAHQYYPPRQKPGAPSSTTTTSTKKSSATVVLESYLSSTTTIVQEGVSMPVHSPTTNPTTVQPTSIPTVFPSEVPTKESVLTDRTEFQLVFSDEFNIAGRDFRDGTDPRWTALDKNDYTNDALHYYSPDNVRTDNGNLIITTNADDTDIIGFDDVIRKRTHVTKHFKSAMLQTWNKFCFTGGIIEAQVTLPGKAAVGGLWPAFWMLGNLARHTYVGGSEHIWPWSSQICTSKSKTAQKVSGCNEVAHYGLEPRLGRGAPEIDIFEVQPGNMKANTGVFLKSSVGQPFMSASFQVAPGRSDNRPGPGEWPGPDQWYSGTKFGINTSLNILFYGAYNHFNDDTNPFEQDYWSDAISYNRQLNSSHFSSPHIYRLEWEVPIDNVTDGYLHWYLDGELVSSINGTGVKNAGLGSEISSEPSYILLNTAVSKQWGFPHECPTNCPCKEYDCRSKDWPDTCGFSEGFCSMMTDPAEPVEYKIDWVRVYQDPTNPTQKVGCSTPERPTRKYIIANENNYKTENDIIPLKGIPRGLGECDPRDVLPMKPNTNITTATGEIKYSTIPTYDEYIKQYNSILPKVCGGRQRGKCTGGKVCECYDGWTGPNCLSHDGYDPILYDVAEKISDVGFVAPAGIPKFLVMVLGGLIIVFIYVITNSRRVSNWEPIPDINNIKQYLDTNGRLASSSYNNPHPGSNVSLHSTGSQSKRRLSV
jgi:beta-glucan synthesis-associated protein KRE6